MKKVYKLKNKINQLKQAYKSKKLFSKKLARYNLFYDINGATLKNYRLQSNLQNKKSKIIFEYIDKYCKESVKLLQKEEIQNIKKDEPFYIWSFWYQNLESAPIIVKKCIENFFNITKNSNFIFKILTIENVQAYIEIPEYILTKVKNKKMNMALFSDFVRISLLEKYGGLWLDSTCYCYKKIPDDIKEYEFFSCKTDNGNKTLISKEQWANYCLGTNQKHNVLYQFLRNSLILYWKNEDSDVDYLLTDYLIRWAYNNIEKVRKSIDNLPINNKNRGSLLPILNNAYDSEKFEKLVKDTWIFKITYKKDLKLFTKENKETFYHHIMEEVENAKS